MPQSASLGILDTIQKRVDRSPGRHPCACHLAFVVCPRFPYTLSPHLCCTIIQTQSCHRGKNCWICRGERSRGDVHRESESLRFFLLLSSSFTPPGRNVPKRRQSTKRKNRLRDTSFTKALRASSRLHKIPLSGMGVGTAHTGVSGEKDKKARLERSFLRDMLCTASRFLYASSYLISAFACFFFLTLSCVCDRLQSTYRKSLRTVLVTNAKEGSVLARQSHRISASRQLLLLLPSLLLHCG